MFATHIVRDWMTSDPVQSLRHRSFGTDPVCLWAGQEGQDPAKATIETSNFEVVEPATRPVAAAPFYLPLILQGYSSPSSAAESMRARHQPLSLPDPGHR